MKDKIYKIMNNLEDPQTCGGLRIRIRKFLSDLHLDSLRPVLYILHSYQANHSKGRWKGLATKKKIGKVVVF